MEDMREAKKGERTESDHVPLQVELKIKLKGAEKRQARKKDIIEREKGVCLDKKKE